MRTQIALPNLRGRKVVKAVKAVRIEIAHFGPGNKKPRTRRGWEGWEGVIGCGDS